ncbi:hypothetical protein BOW53_04200 [Solemya pervernicosa gill symbiont]|uniref:Uncharacterized protein n=1 Tax=Solemya pervernicosa gill symbiont TaxID=642797 RepID=A0A1T2L8A7_9GAMM|nr:hypothetical protein [Solemya pervernicosa gill symbiont]OOZ41325.1 hypothetical protein BOW53_04200 [Solemya pervernicosa gill symbiont]
MLSFDEYCGDRDCLNESSISRTLSKHPNKDLGRQYHKLLREKDTNKKIDLLAKMIVSTLEY